MVIRGNNVADIIRPESDPIIVSFTAKYPFPSFSNLCPGRTPNAVLGSGAPRNMLGIVSRKVCVIARLIIMLSAISAFMILLIVLIFATIIVLIRLTCIPGIKPVIIPRKTPISIPNSTS